MAYTADNFMRDVSARPRKIQVKPAYAVIGEEDFLREQVLADLLHLITETHGEPDVVKLDGDTTDITRLLDELRAKTLFGGHRMVVLTDSGKRGGFIDPNRDRLEQAVSTPVGDATLVLVAGSLNRATRLSKSLDKAQARIDCDRLKAEQLARWVGKRARSMKLDMKPDVEDHFVACAGDRMGVLANELEKLDLSLGDSGTMRTVTRETLDETLGFRGTATSFALVDRIVAGDTPTALRDANILLSQGEHPFALNGLMSWRLRQLWKAAGVTAAGGSSRDAAAAAGNMPPSARQAFMASMRSFDLDTCRALHDELCRADKRISDLKPDVEFEFFVIRVCNRLAQARRAPRS
ncbi:MAG: DNA polymerase III subunit delta [Planctomycetota bacterium]